MNNVILNNKYLYFDAFDLVSPKLFLSDTYSHDTLVLEGVTREMFLEILKGNQGEKIVDYFCDYDFFISCEQS